MVKLCIADERGNELPLNAFPVELAERINRAANEFCEAAEKMKVMVEGIHVLCCKEGLLGEHFEESYFSVRGVREGLVHTIEYAPLSSGFAPFSISLPRLQVSAEEKGKIIESPYRPTAKEAELLKRLIQAYVQFIKALNGW